MPCAPSNLDLSLAFLRSVSVMQIGRLAVEPPRIGRAAVGEFLPTDVCDHKRPVHCDPLNVGGLSRPVIAARLPNQHGANPWMVKKAAVYRRSRHGIGRLSWQWAGVEKRSSRI